MTYGPQPQTNEIFLDHIAHWLAHADAAQLALQQLGFTTTPFSEQRQTDADGNIVPAGSGNYCVMLERGYLEFLVPLADTVIGRELKAGIERYVGVHIAAFACAQASDQHAFMQKLGFHQRPLAKLSREVLDQHDTLAVAQFDVARPRPGVIAEGRVQFLTHHTPELLWQPRYVHHANGAQALTGLTFAVSDLAEAVARYQRILQRAGVQISGGHVFALEHGALTLLDYEAAVSRFGSALVPSAPSMVNYQLECDCAKAFVKYVEPHAEVHAYGPNAFLVTLPAALGASIIITKKGLSAYGLMK